MIRFFSFGLVVWIHGRRTRFFSTLLTTALAVVCAVSSAPAAPPTCYGAVVSLSPDYSYFIGSAGFADASGEAESGSLFRWLANGAPMAAGPVREDLLVHFDVTANGVN